jgi:NADH:ubiquinone oxidoreductase subunit 2 (subunit N)
MPVLFGVFLFFAWDKFHETYRHLYTAGYRDVLFMLFVLLAFCISVYAIWKQYTVVPVLGLLCCLYLMIEIPQQSWMVFIGWMLFGLTIYGIYGYRKSKLRAANAE